MKIDLKNLQNGINLNELSKKVASFIVRKEAYVMFGIFLVLLGYCAYLWYGFIYKYQWDEARKQEYVNTKQAGVVFDKAKFEKVLGALDARQETYQKNSEVQKDIFRLK